MQRHSLLAALLVLIITASNGWAQRAPSAAVGAPPLRELDSETLLMSVQTKRVSLLDAQVKDQMLVVRARNDKIAKMNIALAAAKRIAAQFPSGANAAAATKNTVKAADVTAWEKAAKDADIKTGDLSTKGAVDGQVQSLVSQIDSMTSSQQMDLLRLQSLSKKRNEAFEIMTNFMKKRVDSSASVIGRIR